jgi:C-methyltransferase C-terminal domain/Putative zinc binding domain/Methyltransferase domain
MAPDLACRSCGAGGLWAVLSLGRTPLANALLRPDRLGLPEPTYPLELAVCPGCSLAQLTESVPPERMFREYLYHSSFSETALRHAEALADRTAEARGLGGGSLVVEVASNDGYLLQYYKRRGVPVLGVEPAGNVARWAVERRGIPTVCEFFGPALADRLAAEGRRSDVIHAHNVLAHVPDLNGVVAGFRTLLKPGGVVVVETPHVTEMVDRCEFDTVYHEHLFYYSLTALVRLFDRHGLKALDVERLPIHGGSLRLTAGRGDGPGRPSAAVAALLAAEADWGVDRLGPYLDFAGRVEALGRSIRETLAGLKRRGHRLAAYGASAKGSTLLNYAGVGADLLDYVVDRSTFKQGLYTPGTHLPIHPPEKLLEDMPDFVLLLTWNFADEILAQQAAYRARGGRFVVPVPEVRVV